MNDKTYDVLIVGAGPGGLNAALYTARAGLKVAFIDFKAPGGKMVLTNKIENFIGFKEIQGYQLALQMYEHAKEYGAKHIFGRTVSVNKIDEKFNITLENGEILISKYLIIASGLNHREPQEIINYERFKHAGISFCATCDGPLYKNQEAVVLGDGNSAVEESIFLSSICKKVSLIIPGDKLKAEQILIDRLNNNCPNVTIYQNSKIIEINGQNQIENIVVQQNNETINLTANGLFIFIGFEAKNDWLIDLKINNQNGFIITDNNMQTNIKNCYAIGDIRKDSIRQIATAIGDATIASKHIINDNLNN